MIGSSGSLRKVCTAFGVTLQPLVTAALDKPAAKGRYIPRFNPDLFFSFVVEHSVPMGSEADWPVF